MSDQSVATEKSNKEMPTAFQGSKEMGRVAMIIERKIRLQGPRRHRRPSLSSTFPPANWLHAQTQPKYTISQVALAQSAPLYIQGIMNS